MSSIASFISLPTSALAGLLEAAVPKTRWFGKGKDGFPDYLKQHGSEVADYQWPGYIMTTLLVCLEEEHQINLMASDHKQLGTELTNARGATTFFLTNAHRQYLDALDADKYSDQELTKYYNEFNEANEPESGKSMLDGIRCLQRSIGQLTPDSVVMLHIG